MANKTHEVIDEITANVRNIQRCIFILSDNNGCSDEQRQALDKTTESLAAWETENLHEIRKVFEKE